MGGRVEVRLEETAGREDEGKGREPVLPWGMTAVTSQSTGWCWSCLPGPAAGGETGVSTSLSGGLTKVRPWPGERRTARLLPRPARCLTRHGRCERPLAPVTDVQVGRGRGVRGAACATRRPVRLSGWSPGQTAASGSTSWRTCHELHFGQAVWTQVIASIC